jgi:hypothetical protein
MGGRTVTETPEGITVYAARCEGDRLPAERQWSRKHAETQRYLCERFVWFAGC